MKLSTDIVYNYLSEKYSLQRYGLKERTREMLLPVFYNPQTQTRKGAIYVARTEDLVRKPVEDCLFFCVGPKPPSMWDMWQCEIIHIQDPTADLFSVFNALQRIFGRLSDWSLQMQEFAAAGADIRNMVEASIPLFNNRITVTDYDLNILAHCEVVESPDGNYIEMSNEYVRVPKEKALEQLGGNVAKTQSRDPFFVKEEGRPDNYCVNMFMGNDYIGCCALQEDIRPLHTGDLKLFAVFADYVRQALSAQSNTPGGQLITVRTVFEQLLRRYPVSQYDANRALELANFNLEGIALSECSWYCLAIRSVGNEKVYPERYLCVTIEDLVEGSTVFLHDNTIVAFCVKAPDKEINDVLDVLDEYLEDMNFVAGGSRCFANIFHAFEYYQQALAALSTGQATHKGKHRFMFDDYALGFMLEQCCGDFDPHIVIEPSLSTLAKSSPSGVDYVSTLRSYLDNNCNASRTAKEMFLHRSTLVQRLEHIEKFVDLSTPEKRLFLQMCLHLPAAQDMLASSTTSEE